MEQMLERITEKKGGFALHNLFLYNLILGMETKNALELGAGFSTRTTLEALRITGGKLITCDMRDLKDTGNSEELRDMFKDVWTYLRGDTRTTLAMLPKERVFDVVLHDGSHEWRVVYQDLRKILPRIKQNGILLVHDTEHIPTFHLKLAIELALFGYRHEKMTLPYGYGLTLIRILGNKKNGAVTLTWEKKRTS